MYLELYNESIENDNNNNVDIDNALEANGN